MNIFTSYNPAMVFLVISIFIFFLSSLYIIRHFLKKTKNPFIFLIKFILIFALFPIIMILSLINPFPFFFGLKNNGLSYFGLISAKRVLKRLFFLFLTVGIILPFWFATYSLLILSIADQLGYLEKPISIAGTGSMYPTFPKGEDKDPKKLAEQIVAYPGMIPYPNGLVIGNKRYFNYEINRGDIVLLENKKIYEITRQIYGKPSGWVKRVIALEGDTIELRDGIVYLNGQPQKEPYTARARSTFGQSFLKECHPATVPKNHIFVMGDNRKGSGDSREIGFIEKSAIKYVLPLKNQNGELIKNWRNTDKDFDQSSKITLNKEKYLSLLNEKRKEFGAKPLKYQPKLELSATKRGKVILQYNDFSFEATKSGYTMQKAMNEVGYFNIVWGEAPTQGYYEAEELLENQFQFPQSKKFLLDPDFEEIGIAEIEGEINQCPTKVIVQHFAGYKPPNYPKDLIESWKKALNNLREIQPGWQELKNFDQFYEKYKNDIDRINEIISTRINNITTIVKRMESNQWLSPEEEKMMEEDKILHEEQQNLAKKLNEAN